MTTGYHDNPGYGTHSPCSPEWEDAVSAYADGELPSHRQAVLFGHLANCDACRRHLDVVLVFRRMSRAETLLVPPMADAALMARLDVLQKRGQEPDESRSLWEAKLKLDLGRIAAALLVVFLLGAGITRVSNNVPQTLVSAIQEQVIPRPAQTTIWRVEPVYVFYPGVTVEADKPVE